MASAIKLLATQMEAMEASFLTVFFQAANKIADLTESKLFFLMETSDGVHKIGGNAELKMLFQTGQLMPKNDDVIIDEEEEEENYEAPVPASHSRASSSTDPFSAASSSSSAAASFAKPRGRGRPTGPANKRKSIENQRDSSSGHSSSKKRRHRKNEDEEDDDYEEEEEEDQDRGGEVMSVKVEEGEEEEGGNDGGAFTDLDLPDDEHDKSQGALAISKEGSGEAQSEEVVNADAANKFSKLGSLSQLGGLPDEEMEGGEEEKHRFLASGANPQQMMTATLGFGAPAARPVLSRVLRMQMESLGKQPDASKSANVIVKQGLKCKFEVIPRLLMPVSVPAANVEISDQPLLPTLKGLIVTFDCKKVQIGTMKGTPFEPVTLSIEGLKICMECEDTTINCQVSLEDIKKCMVHYNKTLPCLFITTTDIGATKVRETCHMFDSKAGPYYEPGSEREEQRRIVVLPQAFAIEDQINLEKLFGALTKDLKRKNPTLLKWDSAVALRILNAASGLTAETDPSTLRTKTKLGWMKSR